MIIIRKYFSKYDDTDNLKRMKDSDILAEKYKKPETGAASIAARGLGGALGGAAIGGVGAAALAKYKGLGFNKGVTQFARKLGRGGAVGAGLGAGFGLALGLAKRSREAAANEWYNDRLRYAQRQAIRREKKDWKANMTERDGYSY